MTQLSTTILAELVGKRRKCLAQLRDLGARQAELIAAGETTQLLRLMAGKQQLIEALQALEQRLAPFQSDDPEGRLWPSPAARERCARDADDCRRLIREILELEQNGERQMTLRRDEAACQLQTASASSRVRAAYESQR